MHDRSPLDLAFLGSGNAFAPGRCWSGFLLNGRYLFDAPPTALLSLKRLGVDLAAIDTVLISHFHADHLYGLPFLLLEYAHETRRHSDLTIVGPPGIEERVERLMEIGYPHTLARDSGYQRKFVELDDGVSGDANGLEYRALEVDHAGDDMRCFGFQASVGGRRLSYTGDSAWCEAILKLGTDAEVLVADCTYSEGRGRPEHLSFDEIRDLRATLDPRTAIVLTHLGGPQVSGGLERTHVANDLATFSFP